MTESEDAFGRKVSGYDGIPLVDLGDKPGLNQPVVAIEDRTVNATAETGLTDLYAARMGLDAFHGVSPAGRELVRPVASRLFDRRCGEARGGRARGCGCPEGKQERWGIPESESTGVVLAVPSDRIRKVFQVVWPDGGRFGATTFDTFDEAVSYADTKHGQGLFQVVEAWIVDSAQF